MPDERLPAPFRLRSPRAAPAGFPPDVLPNQIITASHINAIRDSAARWPGDVDGQNHVLRNVVLENAAGVVMDPTTAAGDLIVRGAAALGRLPVGTDGQVLTVDPAAASKLKWAAPAAAPVRTVFGRTGDIVAQAGDYTAAQVTGAVVDPLTTKGDLIARGASAAGRLPVGLNGQVIRANSAAALGLEWTAEAVTSVHGRTGAVVATAGDYTAAEVTNAVSVLGSYPDPVWLTSLSWGKLLGVPASFPPAAHTHAAADIVSGVLATARLGTGIADATVYLRGDGTWAPAGAGGGGGAVTSVFGRAGVVVAQAGDYTAAQVTGAVADPTTIKGDLLVRNDANAIVRLPVGASGQVLQADSSLAAGMKWNTLGAAVQTPWVTNIDAAGFRLNNVSRIGVATASPGYPIDVVGDINVTGVYRVNGVPIAAGGSQTPWTSDIDAAGFALFNCGKIGIGISPASLVGAGTLYVRPSAGTGMQGIAVQHKGTGSDETTIMALHSNPNYGWRQRVRDTDGCYVLDVQNNGVWQPNIMYVNCVNRRIGFNTVNPLNSVQVNFGSDWNIGLRHDGTDAGFSCYSDDGGTVKPMHYNAQYHRFVGNLAIGKAVPSYPIDVAGDINYTGTLRLNGVPVAFGGSQTPWTSDIDANGFALKTLASSGKDLVFSPNATEVLRLTAAGAFSVRGDITVVRPGAPTTGALFFGNGGNKYFYFDGTRFVASANLTVAGSETITDPGQSAVSLTQANGAAGWRIGRSISNNNANDFFIYNDANGAMALSAYDNNVCVAGNAGAGNCRFQVITAAYADPVAGQRKGSVYLNTSSGWGLQVGHYPTGETWFQAQRDDGNGTLYGLSLQPLGGWVTINGINVTNAGRIAFPFNGGFSNMGGAYQLCYYAKNALNKLVLSGCMAVASTASSWVAVGNLPGGYRPAIEQYASINAIYGDNSVHGFLLKFDTSGNVFLWSPVAGPFYFLNCEIPLY